ncbi:MAG: hypothetical protein ACREJ3_11420 [Polyangiaceae bacterium]
MTTAELSALNLQADYDVVLTTPDASRWVLEKPGALEVLVTMSSVGAPAEKFQARFLWVAYPDDPPSMKFRDPATGRLDLPTAWPLIRGFRPPSLDACVNWCLEGFVLHPEWRQDARFRWTTDGNVLLKVLRILQGEIDEHFTGRQS